MTSSDRRRGPRRRRAAGARALALGALLALGAPPRAARAVPGPDSTAILANENDPESVGLAEAYRRARGIPRAFTCLLDLPSTADIGLETYRDQLLAPFEACLERAGASTRIEAVALMRGVPLRVLVPLEGGGLLSASLAAVLSTWKSTLSDGTPVVGQPPGRLIDCGGFQCYAAQYRSAFRRGTFSPGWTQRDRYGVTHRPLLVTMLHGRSYADAARLYASALDAEATTASATAAVPRGRLLLMDGADPARGVLDASYPQVIAALAERGLTAERVPFSSALTGATLSALFTGTAALGDTIEGNAYLPGALVDNVTSFGAVPENFDPGGAEVQVSVARWVARGVAAVHGTVDEPLNNCFPARTLLVDWLDGATLAESFFRALPFVYWRNLVLGDPMAAPFARRPVVSIAGLPADGVVRGSARLTVRAVDPEGRAIAWVRLLVDGAPILEADGPEAEGCVPLAGDGEAELLAVAQVADDWSRGGTHRPKGWTTATLTLRAGPEDCPTPDAGGPEDAGADASPAADAGEPAQADAGMEPGADAPHAAPAADQGCSCRAGRRAPAGAALPLAGPLLMVLAARRAGARRRAGA